jgi:hypothetical protein
MSVRIESLESRLFLSAATLSTDEATLHSDIVSVAQAGVSWQNTLEGDVGRLTGKDKALGSKWEKGDLSKYKALLKADTVGAAAVNKDVAKLDADDASLSASPTSSALQKKVSADESKLQAAATKAQSAITADSNGLESANTAGLTAIGNALPSNTQLQSDIGTIEADGAARVVTIQTDAATVFTTDVGDVIAGS